MTDHVSQGPRYKTLRDYLRVLRTYRVMIVALALIGGGLAAFLSLREDKVYEASASIAFKDETSEFAFFGLSPGQPQPATLVATQNAATVTRPDTLAKASRRLGLPKLNASISTAVDANASLVIVNAQAGDAKRAAQAANAVAGAAVDTANENLRARFRRAARNLNTQSNRRQDQTDINTQSFTQSELARLDALSGFARAADQVTSATAPAEPISPKPKRSIILGVLAGLLAGLLLAFFRDSLDRRMRNSREIQASYTFPVIGYVRNEAMGHTAYVTDESNGRRRKSRRRDEQIELESFRIMRRNLDFLNPGEKLRSILVTSASPNEGKTTVSSSLAFSMAVGGKRTLLVECDFRRPVLAKRLGIEPTPGLGEYLAGNANLQEILRTVEFTDPPIQNGAGPKDAEPDAPKHTLVCIPAGASTPQAAELLGSTRLREFLDQVQRDYDVTIIDTSPLLPVADTRELLPEVDGVIICARELQTTHGQARATLETLEHLPERPTGLVVTGTRPQGEDYDGYAYGYAYQAAQASQ